MNDIIEFYDGERVISSVDSLMVPPVGSLISIRGETWEVISVTYALDYADKYGPDRRMRANVDVRRLKMKKGRAA